jgi:hypothetical protein
MTSDHFKLECMVKVQNAARRSFTIKGKNILINDLYKRKV